MICKKCGKPLTYNEIGLNKKLVGKTQTEFYCKRCLAEFLNVSVRRLDEKQQQFIDSGCCLFAKE